MNQTPEEQQITFQLPPGYTSLIALDRIKHAGLATRPGLGHGWSAKINSVFLNVPEMSKACIDYPIAFVRDSRSGEYLPVALLSLRAEENLYVEKDARAPTSRPTCAAIRSASSRCRRARAPSRSA